MAMFTAIKFPKWISILQEGGAFLRKVWIKNIKEKEAKRRPAKKGIKPGPGFEGFPSPNCQEKKQTTQLKARKNRPLLKSEFRYLFCSK
jgi:hypothetical protein